MPTILFLDGSKSKITFGASEFGGPGSGFKNHKGRDATNERGGSLPRGEGGNTSTTAFKKWFGKSKIVNEDGSPRVVYHTTDQDFKIFNPSEDGESGPGIYFSYDQNYQDASGGDEGSSTIPVYVRMEKPFIFEMDTEFSESEAEIVNKFYDGDVSALDVFVEEEYRSRLPILMEKLGYDGIINKTTEQTELVIYDPAGAKSIYNKGTFDGTEKEIDLGGPGSGFDESKHPRDPKGSKTGGHFKGKAGAAPGDEKPSGPGRSFMSQAIQELVEKTAEQLGFDPKKVFYSDVVVGSELGQTIAQYDPQTQTIEVFRGFTEVGPYSLQGVLAHEIVHSKTYGGNGNFPEMNPEIVTGIKSIVGEDRWNDTAWQSTYEWMPVSEYSEHIKTKTNLGGNRYVHESMAEVARLKVTSLEKYENVDPRWKKLYRSVLGGKAAGSDLSEFAQGDPVVIWLTSNFIPTDESHAAMGKVIDGDKIYFILPGDGAQDIQESEVNKMPKDNEVKEVIEAAMKTITEARAQKMAIGVAPERVEELNRIIYDARMIILEAGEIEELRGKYGIPGHQGGSSSKPHGKIPPKDAGVMKKALAKTDPNKEKYPGATVNLETGEEPTTGYGLSLHPDLTQRVAGWGTMSRSKKKEALRAFIKKNKTMLDKPGNNLGLWMDMDEDSKTFGLMFLDVSVVVEDYDTAYKMSHDANQLEMWDFANKTSIKTGGTGEKLLPPT